MARHQRQRVRLRHSSSRRPRGGGSMRRSAEGYGLIAFPAALAMTIGLMFNGLNNLSGSAAACLMSALLLAGLIIARPPGLDEWRHCARILRPVGLAILWLLLNQSGFWTLFGVTGPFAPDLFLPGMLGIAGAICAFLGGAFIAADRRNVEETIDMLIILMSVFLAIGLLFVSIDMNGLFDYWAVERQGRFSGTIGNINTTACICGIVLLLSVSKAADALVPARRDLAMRDASGLTIYGLTILIALFAGLGTAARLPIMASLVLMLLLLFWLMRREIHVTRPQKFLLAFVIVAAVVAWLLGSGAVVRRFADVDTALGTRSLMLTHYLDVAMDSPFVGYGLSSFPSVNSFFMTDLEAMLTLHNVNSPHNILLQLLLVGGIPYAILILVAAWRVVRFWIVRERAGQVSRIELGIAASLLLILSCAMIDIVLDIPATINLSLFLAGLLHGCGLSRRPSGSTELRTIPA